MADVLQINAQNFLNATKYNYVFTVSKTRKFVLNLNLRCLADNYTHIMGLDHLKDIAFLNTNKISNKTNVFQSILNGTITFGSVANSKYLYAPLYGTFNCVTNTQHTIYDRLVALQDIESILDVAYLGVLYKWQNTYNATITPLNEKRSVNIKATYMLAIPYNNTTIYIFMYKNDKKSTASKIVLDVLSAFPDSINLTIGQSKPYTILKLEKVNINTNKVQELHRRKNYIE